MREAMTIAVAYTLKRVRDIAPSAIVAGGYLRDRLNFVSPKDVDIFVEPLGLQQQFDLAKRFPLKKDTATQFLEYTGGEFSEVCGVWSLGIADGYSVQLIEVDKAPEQRAREHDFGICQVYHDGTDLHVTDAFLKDHSERTFTLSHCESKAQFDRSMARYERLSMKYPSYPLVIPQEFQQWQ